MRLKGTVYVAGLCLLVLATGCSKPAYEASASGAVAADAMQSPEDAFLAYEHTVQLQMPGKDIAPRVKAVTEACQSGTFGDCAVLNVSQQAGDTPSALIKVRIAPKGVESIIGLASEKGEITTRNTEAEDLAQQVADTKMAQARLKNEHDRLLEYQQRRDIEVADLLTIAGRLSEIEAGLEQANRDAGQQRRRIDTQLVTLNLQSPSSQRSRSEIGSALAESAGIFTTTVAYLIRFFAGLLPVLVIGGGVVCGSMKLWRRRKIRKQGANTP